MDDSKHFKMRSPGDDGKGERWILNPVTGKWIDTKYRQDANGRWHDVRPDLLSDRQLGEDVLTKHVPMPEEPSPEALGLTDNDLFGYYDDDEEENDSKVHRGSMKVAWWLGLVCLIAVVLGIYFWSTAS